MATRFGWQKAQTLEKKGWKIQVQEADSYGDPILFDIVTNTEYTPYEAELIQDARHQLDMVSRNTEYLSFQYESYTLEFGEVKPEVEAFYNWCLKDNQDYLDAKRSPDGKSFRERAALPAESNSIQP